MFTAITESYNDKSSILLDRILFPLVYKKWSLDGGFNGRRHADYVINVIPAGTMQWDEKRGIAVCEEGEEQCNRNLLQYCAIREYSFELAQEFVRCIQT